MICHSKPKGQTEATVRIMKNLQHKIQQLSGERKINCSFRKTLHTNFTLGKKKDSSHLLWINVNKAAKHQAPSIHVSIEY